MMVEIALAHITLNAVPFSHIKNFQIIYKFQDDNLFLLEKKICYFILILFYFFKKCIFKSKWYMHKTRYFRRY